MRLFFEELLIGFEFKNFLIALFALLVVYLAWESTYVRDYRVHPNAVLIIENNRRLLVDIGDNTNPEDLRPGTGWTLEGVPPDATVNERSTIETEEASSESSNSPEIIRVDGNSTTRIPEPPPTFEVVIEEVHDLATARRRLNEDSYTLLDHDGGPQRVIEAMDTTEGIRRRRLAFYDQDRNAHQPSESGEATSGLASGPATTSSGASAPKPEPSVANISPATVQGDGESTDSQINTENCSNENSENESKSKIEEGANMVEPTEAASSEGQDNTLQQKQEIRIKLKYLNDDMKMVKGSPSENIGDFKKRNFTLELGAQKFVRLVFNGHVLQPDSKTLEACGLFDNCVVHCLVHNRNPNAANQNQQSGHSSLGQENSNQTTNRGARNQGNNDGPALGNFSNHESNNSHLMAMYAGIAFITLSLILCWYCRIQYHVFFSWYSTLVLILVTVLFSILGPLMVLIENNEAHQTT